MGKIEQPVGFGGPHTANFDTLAHSDSVVINALPYVVIVLAGAAALYAIRLRGTDTGRYERIGHLPGTKQHL